ncbi:MAG: hypothetical protein U0871_17925 [Gemmataceae bacterium]
MLGRRFPIPGLPTPRQLVLALLAVVQLMAGVGFPIPTSRASKDRSQPYPCMDRPCGCLTYEQCWAGDCCCFTLREKVAWATARGLVVPAAVGRSCCDPHDGDGAGPDCRPASSDCPHCDPPAADASPAYRWVDGAMAQRCKGRSPAGWSPAGPAVPPIPATVWAFEWVPAGAVLTGNSTPISSTIDPVVPPPRA